MEITLSIVGTAGRNDDAKRLSRKHFDAMCIVGDALIDQLSESNYPITHLVSGGAAWADHVAVKLFLNKKVPHLKLFLPCEWDWGTFRDTGQEDWKINPGRTLNKYHKQFQMTSGINSLSDIQIAKGEGAELIPTRGGFHGRNAMVAKSDFILACTFGNKHEVKDGGTSHCVGCYLDRVRKEGIWDKSFHYDLNCGEVFVGCTVPKEEDNKLKYFQLNVGRGNPKIYSRTP
jgi:hypothetical protein